MGRLIAIFSTGIALLLGARLALGELSMDQSQVVKLVDEKWAELIQPTLPRPKPDDPSDPWVSWGPRIAPPLPEKWPAENPALVFYVYARGMNPRVLRDGEFTGPFWARIVAKPDGKLEFTQVAKKIEMTGRQGVRPVTEQELEIIRLDPIDLMKSKRTKSGDDKLRAYYCLSIKLGNLPRDILLQFGEFTDWLGCR